MMSGKADNLGAVFQGFVKIPMAGQWRFGTESDDGTKLYVS
jgi:hypothetical protein